MSEPRFSTWQLLVILAVLLLIIVGSVATGMLIGYQWGKAKGTAEAQSGRGWMLTPPRIDPEIEPPRRMPFSDMQPYLGIRYLMLTATQAEQEGLEVGQGAWVIEIMPASPAAKSGLQIGDVIVRVDETPIDQQHPLAQVIRQYEPGDEIELVIVRDGKRTRINLRLEAAHDFQRPSDPWPDQGLRLRPRVRLPGRMRSLLLMQSP